MPHSHAQAIKWERGSPVPLGASPKDNGVNFALYSQHATGVTLCLFAPHSKHPYAEIPLDPEANKTGLVWHILLTNLPGHHLEYGYKITGPNEDPRNLFNPEKILSDPYALSLSTSHQWGYKNLNEEESLPRGRVIIDCPFDWEGALPPKIPMEDLVIYEMHVRSFTQHPSSKSRHPGTFLGIVDKIPYLKSLGVNAIELMPIFEFDECENDRCNPRTKQKLQNYWGYSTINFFAPMNRYSSSHEWASTLDDFRTLVREMHKNGIEVYLDVVYNHTAEGNQNGPYFSFRGIDNCIYYMINPEGHYLDYTGTGNTVNSNHPVVAQFILDSLRYWVNEMHVDGFRFDLASCLTRNEHGVPLPNPPVIQAMTTDPVLANIKLIAEAWDAGGLYQVGTFPGEGRWFEWNGKYRDVVRRFLKGTNDQSGEFAKVLSGSQDLYGLDRTPCHSINFITAHDGFTLRDLVSYNDKHNEENGEESRDGCNSNDSWNCGHEGPTADRKILLLRERQIRNFQVALMVALGTPMVLMGDEYGHTRNGNNNAYCQDNELNWFLWDELAKNQDFARFHRLMIQFRKKNPLVRRNAFLRETDVKWHGLEPLKANWSGENRFIAYTLEDEVKSEPLYIAFNAQFQPSHIHLPDPPKGKKWYRIVDTSLPSPSDYCEKPTANPPLKFTYDLPEYSALILKAL
ncbi:MAG: glycogen debranching protein GlgX [Verrucomicrobia bacterium]|nr:glycogen debranching protein GlgX [Verrucomicrobiota bacterium]